MLQVFNIQTQYLSKLEPGDYFGGSFPPRPFTDRWRTACHASMRACVRACAQPCPSARARVHACVSLLSPSATALVAPAHHSLRPHGRHGIARWHCVACEMQRGPIDRDSAGQSLQWKRRAGAVSSGLSRLFLPFWIVALQSFASRSSSRPLLRRLRFPSAICTGPPHARLAQSRLQWFCARRVPP